MRGESKSTAHGMRFVNFEIFWGGVYFFSFSIGRGGRLALRAKRGQRSEHLRFAVEHGAFFDLKNGGLDRSFDDGGGLNLDSLGRENVPIELTGNNDDIGFDLPVYLGLVTND